MSIRIRRFSGNWNIDCATCDGNDFLAALTPWMRAATWQGALALANWHADLHREQQCPACLHVPPLPRPEVVDRARGLFAYEGQIYALSNQGVHALEASK